MIAIICFIVASICSYKLGQSAIEADVKKTIKSIRFAQGISEDERWFERASAYKQAADWLEEIVGK